MYCTAIVNYLLWTFARRGLEQPSNLKALLGGGGHLVFLVVSLLRALPGLRTCRAGAARRYALCGSCERHRHRPRPRSCRVCRRFAWRGSGRGLVGDQRAHAPCCGPPRRLAAHMVPTQRGARSARGLSCLTLHTGISRKRIARRLRARVAHVAREPRACATAANPAFRVGLFALRTAIFVLLLHINAH